MALEKSEYQWLISNMGKPVKGIDRSHVFDQAVTDNCATVNEDGLIILTEKCQRLIAHYQITST